jgi:hypothetical protein
VNACMSNYSGSRAERMSAIELAIRAESKKFLSSPLVVQVLENIWSGKIVRHLLEPGVILCRYFIVARIKDMMRFHYIIQGKRLPCIMSRRRVCSS